MPMSAAKPNPRYQAGERSISWWLGPFQENSFGREDVDFFVGVVITRGKQFLKFLISVIFNYRSLDAKSLNKEYTTFSISGIIINTSVINPIINRRRNNFQL